jgi:thiol-disulfide isomerase/thioredoxin
MNKKLTIVSKLFVLFSMLALVASVTSVFSPKVSYAEEKVEVNFFYGDGCPHCAKAKTYLYSIEKTYPQITLVDFEVYKNNKNQELCDIVKQQPKHIDLQY